MRQRSGDHLLDAFAGAMRPGPAKSLEGVLPNQSDTGFSRLQSASMILRTFSVVFAIGAGDQNRLLASGYRALREMVCANSPQHTDNETNETNGSTGKMFSALEEECSSPVSMGGTELFPLFLAPTRDVSRGLGRPIHAFSWMGITQLRHPSAAISVEFLSFPRNLVPPHRSQSLPRFVVACRSSPRGQSGGLMHLYNVMNVN